METKPLPKNYSLSKILSHSSYLDSICRKLLLKKLVPLKYGQLIILDKSSLPHRKTSFGEEQNHTHKGHHLSVTLTIHRSKFYSRTVLGGSIGNAESYIDSDWDTDNLTGLIRLFVLNREVLNGIDESFVNLLTPFQKFFHGLNKNTIEGSQKNIKSHYDMGNDFFKLFLDKTMMYSSAIFPSKESSLEEASYNKMNIILKKLNLKEDDHLIEIGTGWGSLALHAAKQFGCKVTTTTISREQYDFVQRKIRDEKLEGQVTLLFEDYRKLEGQFDALVSVEMIEAVGLDHLDQYFEKCSSLLKPDGRMVLQAITIRDQFYESAKKSVDFIQRHIFPGSGIPSIESMMNSVKRKTDLCLIEQNDFAEDYAETLKRWSENLAQKEEKIIELGYPAYLYRLWKYYFSYCEGGFRERSIGVSHLLFSKPLHRHRYL